MVYICFQLIILLGIIALYVYSLTAFRNFHTAYQYLVANPGSTLAYSTTEYLIEEKFNGFFFGAASSCQSE